MAAATLLGVRESPRHFASTSSSLNNSQRQSRTSNPNRHINDPDSEINRSNALLLEDSTSSNRNAPSGNSPHTEQVILETDPSTIAHSLSTTAPYHNSTNYISISTLGFGIGNSATVAAQQALQDATSRTHWSMSNTVHQQSPLLDIQFGVPASLPVHTSELKLPLGVTSIHIVPGGLLVEGDSSSLHGPLVSVVACITLKIPPISPWVGTMSTRSPSAIPTAPNISTKKFDSMAIPEALFAPTRALPAAPVISSLPPTASSLQANSIEMLALLSESLVQKQPHQQHQTTTAKGQRRTSTSSIPSLTLMGRRDSGSTNESSDGDVSSSRPGSVNGSSSSYIKLAPGKTTKNHDRRFVKHQYRDYSDEEPTSEEIVLQFTHMSPNAAFPLKLHETLSAVEKDGLASIIGWLPHGVRILLLCTGDWYYSFAV